jgi:hypothetical protein
LSSRWNLSLLLNERTTFNTLNWKQKGLPSLFLESFESLEFLTPCLLINGSSIISLFHPFSGEPDVQDLSRFIEFLITISVYLISLSCYTDFVKGQSSYPLMETILSVLGRSENKYCIINRSTIISSRIKFSHFRLR